MGTQINLDILELETLATKFERQLADLKRRNPFATTIGTLIDHFRLFLYSRNCSLVIVGAFYHSPEIRQSWMLDAVTATFPFFLLRSVCVLMLLTTLQLTAITWRAFPRLRAC